MRIKKIEYHPVVVKNKEAFKIATGTSFATENVVVEVNSEGKKGWGAGATNDVTQETNRSMLDSLNSFRNELEEKEIQIEKVWSDFREKYPNDPSALAALDIALHDLKGKEEEKRVFELFHGKEKGVPTDMTIGIMDEEETVKHAEDYIDKGFKALKIKIGLDMESDLDRIGAVRETVGSKVKIWVDANQGYSTEKAKKFCDAVEEYDIEFVEQPVDEDDLKGLKDVTEHTTIPIVADEAMKGPESAEKICEERAADMVNIKLMKCGGLTGGRKIVDIIEEHDIKAMVGCMLELEPSLSAAVHLFNSSDNIKYADLDSHFMMPENVFDGLSFKDGELWTSKDYGLGVNISQEKLEKYF